MRHGFSLVELSIVLVILGLLTGGILTGQTLIRAAELRSVTTEYQRYLAASQTFRDKYFAIPGDMRNASAFWETQITGCGSNATVNATTGACDGDGNGVLGADTAANGRGENFQFWRHLALAGLVEGTYSGTAAAAVDAGIFDENIPRSKLSNAGWSIFTDADENDVTGEVDLEYGNSLMFGGAITNDEASAAVLVPEEAWNIDTKLDDGISRTGRVVGLASGVCVATGTDAYALTLTAEGCAMIFTRQF